MQLNLKKKKKKIICRRKFLIFQVLDDIHELINGLSNISIEKYRRQALGNYPMLLICTHVSLVG